MTLGEFMYRTYIQARVPILLACCVPGTRVQVAIISSAAQAASSQVESTFSKRTSNNARYKKQQETRHETHFLCSQQPSILVSFLFFVHVNNLSASSSSTSSSNASRPKEVSSLLQFEHINLHYGYPNTIASIVT